MTAWAAMVRDYGEERDGSHYGGNVNKASPFLNITPQGLLDAKQRSKLSIFTGPGPERWLRPNGILWKVGDWEVLRPFRETLLDVMVDHLKYTFGKAWAAEQYALPEEERHAAMRWWFGVCEAQKQGAPAGHKVGQAFAVPITGEVSEFGWLANDLYHLRLADALPKSIQNRLRSKDQYQGARYEVAVAGMLVRVGFQIRWIEGHEKHCEFEATHRLTNEAIVVEAKSRHISGTLHQPGERPKLGEIKFKAHRYYNDALKQCPHDRPSAIFIDLNLPSEAEPETQALPWWGEVRQMLERLPQPSASEPAAETCLALTNFTGHYAGRTLVSSGPRYEVMFPMYARHPLRNLDTFAAIIRALERYSFIPLME